jgi:hypothetical protein
MVSWIVNHTSMGVSIKDVVFDSFGFVSFLRFVSKTSCPAVTLCVLAVGTLFNVVLDLVASYTRNIIDTYRV